MALPTHADTDDFARLVGNDSRTVRRLVKQGVLQRDAKGFLLSDQIPRFIKYREQCAAERAGGGDYGKARISLITEQAKKAKHAREIQEGAYMLCDEVEYSWGKMFGLIKTQFLALPTRAAPSLVAMRTPMHAQQVLQPMVREILDNIAATELKVEKPQRKKAS